MRKLLIADPDPAVERSLGPALRRRGYQVHAAHDGSRALELAILRTPDLVLLDEEAPLLDARSFVRILRTNPRTERIPVVLTGSREDPARARLGAYLRKPLQPDEVLARVDQVLRGAEAARAAGAGAGLQGELSEIGLLDLLQMLAMNRKTGRLLVTGDGPRGQVALADGRVVDAELGPAVGEKAVARLVLRRSGRFTFVPGPPGGPSRLDRAVEELVMEAVRQADELVELAPSAPAPGERVALAVRAGAVPEGLHPAAAEVVALLAAPRTVQELLDRASASDLDVLRALATLLERGYARREHGAVPAGERPPLLPEPALEGLRRRVARGAGRAAVGKVLLAGGGPLARRAALARLAALPGFAPQAGGAPVELGTLGRLALGDGLQLDLVALPSDPALAPLWPALAAGAVAALLVPPADGGLAGRAAALARGLRVPLGACVGVAPAEGALALEADPAAALVALLAAAAQG